MIRTEYEKPLIPKGLISKTEEMKPEKLAYQKPIISSLSGDEGLAKQSGCLFRCACPGQSQSC